MKGGDRNAKAARIAPHLVERQQPEIAIVCGIFGCLGHDRTGRLLEMHCSMERLIDVDRELWLSRVAGEHPMQKIENAQVLNAPAFLRVRKRPFDIATVFGPRSICRYVGAVDRKSRDHFFERRQHPVQRKISSAPVPHRQAVKFVRQHVQFAAEIHLRDAMLRGVELSRLNMSV